MGTQTRTPLRTRRKNKPKQVKEQEASQEDCQEGSRRRQEEEEVRGDLQDLHLQGSQAGPPRHRNLLQGHEHHELLHQRYLRKIATEASKLARYNKKPTITSREIQTAVRLILPGELAKHAVSEG